MVTTTNVNRLIIINMTAITVSYKNEISKPTFLGIDVAESKEHVLRKNGTSSDMPFLHPARQPLLAIFVFD